MIACTHVCWDAHVNVVEVTCAELEFERFVIHCIHFLHCSDTLAPCIQLSCHGHMFSSRRRGSIGVSKESGLTSIAFPAPSSYDKGYGGS